MTRSAILSERPKAVPEALARLRATCPSLPDSYLAFLARSDGVEGDLGIEPEWVVVWPADETVRATDAYEIPNLLPGFFAFGDNGGGELFVFPVQNASGERPIYMVPAIGMAAAELIEIAPSFASFAAQVGKALG